MNPAKRLTPTRSPSSVEAVVTGPAEGNGLRMLGEVRDESHVTVVALHGDLDLMTVDALRDLLDGVVTIGQKGVIVDLSDVAFVDVLSLSVILGSADAMRERGRQLLVRGASSAVRRICALLNADDILAPALPVPRTAYVNN